VEIAGIAVQPDGAILLSGRAYRQEENRSVAAVVRLSSSGRADETFGDRGLATVDPENVMPLQFRHANPMTELGLHPDGRILATGSQRAYDVHEPADPLVARFLPNGTPDPTFDDNGVAKIGVDFQTAILPRADGALVALGWEPHYFGQSSLAALRVPATATGFAVPAPIASNVFGMYDWNRAITGLAARAETDGSILYAGELESTGGRVFVAWVRIGPDLELLERGKRPARAGTVGTFDSRGALLTAEAGQRIAVRRFRGPRFRQDGSFGWPGRQPDVGSSAKLIGMEMQGRNKVLLAAHPGTWPPADVKPEPLTLFRLHAHQDVRGPIVTLRGLPRRDRCAAEPLDPLVRIRDESRVRASARLDRRHLTTKRRKRFRVEIDTRELRAGPHKLVVRALDAAGNLGRLGTAFRVCARG
jgi:uncharacterized delta-60 repeat protein